MRHGDDGLHNGIGALLRAKVIDEGTVDFKYGDTQLVQAAERGVAGAEVIDRKGEALRGEYGHLVGHLAKIAHDGGLGNFKMNPVGINRIAPEGSQETPGKVFVH